MNKIRISEHFMLYEFECKDGSHLVKVKASLLKLLENIRAEASRIKGKDCPVTIVSGFRTKSHNDAVGGADDSRHLYGDAADIRVKYCTPAEVAAIAERCGADGIGLHDKNGKPYTFCHVDKRGKKARW